MLTTTCDYKLALIHLSKVGLDVRIHIGKIVIILLAHCKTAYLCVGGVGLQVDKRLKDTPYYQGNITDTSIYSIILHISPHIFHGGCRQMIFLRVAGSVDDTVFFQFLI